MMADSTPLTITRRLYGKTCRDEEVCAFTLRAGGCEMEVLDYGGIVTRLLVPNAQGELADIVLGCSSLADFEAHAPYFNCIVGRVGNRIAAGRFSLDGREYVLPVNSETGGLPCHLHGGTRGLDKRVWAVRECLEEHRVGLEMTYTSPDGEEGYPGEIAITVRYWLTSQRVWRIEYEAVTDAPTLFAPTQHAYFNLAGEASASAETILGHTLQLNADRFTPTDCGLIPTGELAPVAGTPFDFREPKPIGQDILCHDPQLLYACGYDHNWVLNRSTAVQSTLTYGGRLSNHQAGRHMEFWTTEPGVQVYTSNFLDNSFRGKSGSPYCKHGAICLETQHFPDAPNKADFPSIVLRPGSSFESVTEYRFTV